ncbi:hypothetical protein [Shewanella surugensis]|uniref:Phycocyanobilin:ferredoxin oxidoreductase n=1 Tax=Shewanella surugensis TaxID=212020 RepID=A0ABT0LK84_9GAMM|nr:hypothetical protein [Shewanella surugensis]MCL1127875.1 hypothetical protein [Shewanella surugensis]
MSQILAALTQMRSNIITQLNDVANEQDEPAFAAFNYADGSWVNRIWKNEHFRYAHLNIVNMSGQQDFRVIHMCIFPHFHSNAPIFGIDLIANHKLITGAYLDYSPTCSAEHPLSIQFTQCMRSLNWKRKRELPEWAIHIFSPNILAIGGIKTDIELQQLIKVVDNTLAEYLKRIGDYHHNIDDAVGRKAQNFYCEQQKKNLHLRSTKFITTLKIDEDKLDTFINLCYHSDN